MAKIPLPKKYKQFEREYGRKHMRYGDPRTTGFDDVVAPYPKHILPYAHMAGAAAHADAADDGWTWEGDLAMLVAAHAHRGALAAGHKAPIPEEMHEFADYGPKGMAESRKLLGIPSPK
jgi:hypothetical protein